MKAVLYVAVVFSFLNVAHAADVKVPSREPPPNPTFTATPDPLLAAYYIDPQGSDANPGTREQPFATPGKAQAAVRSFLAALKPAAKGGIAVFVSPGTYFLPETLTFTAEDSGPETVTVVWKSPGEERPVFSGGLPVGAGGWKRDKGDVWVTEVEQAKNGKWVFRDLYADGNRLPRARHPNSASPYAHKLSHWRAAKDNRVKASYMYPLNKDDFFEVVDFRDEARKHLVLDRQIPGGDIGKGAEMVLLNIWSITRAAVMSSDKNELVSRDTLGNEKSYFSAAHIGHYLYLENARAFVDSPGEWFLDGKTGLLYYHAAPGTDPGRMRFIAPRLAHILKIAGESGRPVRNLHFEKIAFSHADWTLPDGGFSEVQAHWFLNPADCKRSALPEAVDCRYFQNGSFRACAVSHTGANGIGLIDGCSRSKLLACEVFDVGGNGITIGNLLNNGAESGDAASDIEVSDCSVHDAARMAFGCVGIWQAFVPRTRIARNHVYGLPYSAISIGWRWDDAASAQRETAVENNYIHDYMRMLTDGAGIYSLGRQNGAIFRGNVIVNGHNFANGFQHDQGNSFITIQNNLVYNVGEFFVHFNPAHDITYENNIFIQSHMPGVNRSAQNQDHRFVRNIFYLDRPELLGGQWQDKLAAAMTFQSNLYFNARGPAVSFPGGSFKAWQEKGFDAGSLVADPLFANPAGGDFTLRKDSPALRLGFKPFDYTAAGPVRTAPTAAPVKLPPFQ